MKKKGGVGSAEAGKMVQPRALATLRENLDQFPEPSDSTQASANQVPGI